MGTYVSGGLTFNGKAAGNMGILEMLLRFIAQEELLPEDDSFPSDKEEYDELLDEAKSYLLREVCDSYENDITLKWCGEEFPVDVTGELDRLLVFAKKAGLSVDGDIAIDAPDDTGEVIHWLPKEDLSGYDKYDRHNYEVHKASAQELFLELAKRGALKPLKSIQDAAFAYGDMQDIASELLPQDPSGEYEEDIEINNRFHEAEEAFSDAYNKLRDFTDWLGLTGNNEEETGYEGN